MAETEQVKPATKKVLVWSEADSEYVWRDGFTHEDVEVLSRVGSKDFDEYDKLRDLATRISNFLPPEKP